MPMIFFVGELVAMEGVPTKGAAGGWAMIVLPERESVKLPSRDRVPIAGTINGFAFRTTALPTGDGTHHIMVNKAMREGAGIALGGRVTVVIDVDTLALVEIPVELEKALDGSKLAKAAFEKLSLSQRREIAGYVAEAKKEEARVRRAAETIAKLAYGAIRAR